MEEEKASQGSRVAWIPQLGGEPGFVCVSLGIVALTTMLSHLLRILLFIAHVLCAGYETIHTHIPFKTLTS